MNLIRRIIIFLYKRIVIHWVSTFKAVVYTIILGMWVYGKINVDEWIAATATLVIIEKLIGKDDDKIETKDEYKL